MITTFSLLLSFAICIAIVPTANAQFPIKIPSIPKIKKEKASPQSEKSAGTPTQMGWPGSNIQSERLYRESSTIPGTCSDSDPEQPHPSCGL